MKTLFQMPVGTPHIDEAAPDSRALNSFFTLSRDLMCVAGFDGSLKAVNPAWKTALGFDEADLISRSFMDFVHPDDRETTAAELQRLVESPESVAFENRCRTRDGDCRWLSWNARRAGDEHLIHAIARDVTESRRAMSEMQRLQAALQQRTADLESTNQELEAFSYSVSHDLRAPIRHIEGFVQLFEREAGSGLDEHPRHYLKVIADSARQLSLLIDSLLLFSRTGRAQMRRTRINSGRLVRETVTALEHELPPRRIEWTIHELPDVTADASMLRQVWAHLLSNAAKYTRPRNPAQIEIGCATSETEHVFCVRDNGVGFSMEYANRLFGVFQRLHRGDEFEGVGIGLANVRQIIRRHGGRTWAEGRADQGASFFFSLPVREETEPPGNR